MAHDIKKETYVDADEKTTKALTFDLLDSLFVKMDETSEFHVKHLEACGRRFKKIENGKKKDTAVAAGSGVIGGSLTVIGIWLKNKFLG